MATKGKPFPVRMSLRETAAVKKIAARVTRGNVSAAIRHCIVMEARRRDLLSAEGLSESEILDLVRANIELVKQLLAENDELLGRPVEGVTEKMSVQLSTAAKRKAHGDKVVGEFLEENPQYGQRVHGKGH